MSQGQNLEQYLPNSGHVRALVEDAAIACWHLWRRQRIAHRPEQELLTTQPDPGQSMSGVFHSQQILQRYKNATELSCCSAYANPEAIRKENSAPACPGFKRPKRLCDGRAGRPQFTFPVQPSFRSVESAVSSPSNRLRRPPKCVIIHSSE